jgi:regulator of cell morphogenesis and NO signaling
MKKQWKFQCNDNMSDLVEHDYRTLLVVSRFGIGLGFGDKTIAEACVEHGVDPDTFIAVMNTVLDGDERPSRDISRVSAVGLIDFLSNTHVYYLDCRLPAIRRELVELWDGPASDLSRVVIEYFDEIVTSVGEHAAKEERELFPYVRALVDGNATHPLQRELLPVNHRPMKRRLMELRRILIKYYPVRDTNRMNDVMFELYNWEHDLVSHIRVEELLLAPVIENLEHKTLARIS